MAKKNGLDYLYVVWQDPISRTNFTIGTLTRNGQYVFTYGVEVDRARKHGFTPLVSFPNFAETYHSSVMFPAFSCRLPDPRRRGIDTILEKYSMTEYDEFEFLRKSGARLPTDTLSFIDPIFPDEAQVSRIFPVAGVRHYLACVGNNCKAAIKLAPGTKLFLSLDSNNEYDPYAVRISTADETLLGYVPRYFSEAVSTRLKNGAAYTCEVVDRAQGNACGECLKVCLQIPPAASSTLQNAR